MASFTDIIQEMIELGIKISLLEVHKGWIEIHDKDDVKLAEELLND